MTTLAIRAMPKLLPVSPENFKHYVYCLSNCPEIVMSSELSKDLGIHKFGPWYGWPDCDLKLFVESLLKINSYEANVITTSHGGILENKSDAFLNCVKIIFDREESIIKRLDEGRSKSEIVSEGIYYFNKSRAPEHLQPSFIMWDDFMFEHHMKIIAEGGLNKLFKNLA